jgi:hypothetical protein
MTIAHIAMLENGIISITASDGRVGTFDITPYLEFEAFQLLNDPRVFGKARNGGYFIEWDCGADLSADTIEAHWKIVDAGTNR